MSDEHSTIAEPYGIRWGVVDTIAYPVRQQHGAHDLTLLLTEESGEVEESNAGPRVFQVPESLQKSLDAAPPPLPPPLPPAGR